jgi:hypothetical protein
MNKEIKNIIWVFGFFCYDFVEILSIFLMLVLYYIYKFVLIMDNWFCMYWLYIYNYINITNNCYLYVNKNITNVASKSVTCLFISG